MTRINLTEAKSCKFYLSYQVIGVYLTNYDIVLDGEDRS